MDTVQISSHERSQHEMTEKSALTNSFLTPRYSEYRPVSVATEFMEDWEVDDPDDYEIYSDGEDGQNSPRVSLDSSGGQRSITTLSSYDEVQTPRSSKHHLPCPFDAETKSVEGPRGPHLFRSSTSSAGSVEFQHALSLSPLTPTVPVQEFHLPIALDLTPLPSARPRDGPFAYSHDELDAASLREWSPEMVAQWMLNAGVEQSACDRFVENDIQGAILITLKFEDLKELGISSFGMRTKVWDEIHNMRSVKLPATVPDTDIEDAPDKEARKELRRNDGDGRPAPRRGPSRRRPRMDDVVTPLESVSIVGIEQVMPKPHHCSKGEKCRKWQRNKRLIETFKKEHPFADRDTGTVMVAGDPGNPDTAEAIRPADDEVFRPVSDAVPSVVASSDVMGPGSMPTFQHLAETSLRAVLARDPQDNVRQFLDFQRQHTPGSSEVPPTPPFEILPARKPAPHQNLRSLSKLTIPGAAPAAPRAGSRLRESVVYSASTAAASAVSSSSSSTTTTTTSKEESNGTPYRFGTPFSDMDVPLTAVATGPVARDASQSVPPDMSYRHNPAPPRSMSRSSARRPSFPVLPALDENAAAAAAPPAATTRGGSPTQRPAQRPLQPPPRVRYPWTPAARPTPLEKAVAPSAGGTGTGTGTGTGGDGSGDAAAVSYQGPMRKRRTRMLRHEWQEGYFTLRGTRLAMHKDEAAAAAARARALESVDIDDYAVACSAASTGSRLNAAFKAMSIRRGGAAGDVAAFSFQLVPQDAHRAGARMRMFGEAAAGAAGGGKTHHFAVASRDERIDWMRELMLAKAMKQKGEGFEVSVNGNMI